jgi:uncharacterized protein (DUF302 family)
MQHPMVNMMFATYTSKLGFDETVAAIRERAVNNGWRIPFDYDLQAAYVEAGHTDMTRVIALYICNPDGGHAILQNDDNKAMSVMMPSGLTIYETTTGEVRVSAWNYGLMRHFFGGKIKQVLNEATGNLAHTLEGVIE